MIESLTSTSVPVPGAGAELRLYLTVTLRGTDPSALTAAYALQHHLGYGDQLRGLQRLHLWRFELAGSDSGAALARVGSWVTRSQLFVNPNQHSYQLVAAGTPVAHRTAPHQPWILVQNDPDLEGEAATALVRDRLGDRTLHRARQAVVWQLDLDPALDAARQAAIATEIAVSRGRQSGLLTNPHYQTASVQFETSAALAGAHLWDDA